MKRHVVYRCQGTFPVNTSACKCSAKLSAQRAVTYQLSRCTLEKLQLHSSEGVGDLSAAVFAADDNTARGLEMRYTE